MTVTKADKSLCKWLTGIRQQQKFQKITKKDKTESATKVKTINHGPWPAKAKYGNTALGSWRAPQVCTIGYRSICRRL